MLIEHLSEDKIQVLSTVDSWQNAIKIAAKPLIQENSITSAYVDSIFEQHEKLGTYYLLAPHIAMPHARANNDVFKSVLSLLIVNEGVNFGNQEKDPIHLIFLLAAKDNTSHLTIISSLMELLINESDINVLVQSNNKNQIIDIIKKY